MNVEASWCGLKLGCSSGLYLTTKAKSNSACKHTDTKNRGEKGVMQAIAQGDKRMLVCSLARELIGQLQLLNRIEKHQLSFSLRSQKITGIVTTAAASWGRRQATFLIYLVVDTLAVESYVNGEGGGVVVRDEQRLLVRFVPHHKVQRGGALMEKTHVGYQEDRRGTEREETCC